MTDKDHMAAYFQYKDSDKKKAKDRAKEKARSLLIKKYHEHEKWKDENDPHRISDRERYWDAQKK